LILKRSAKAEKLASPNPQQGRGSVDAQATIAQLHQNL
jgi:hypothetical protein